MVTESIKLDAARHQEEMKLPALSSFILKRVEVIEEVATIDESPHNLDMSSVLNPSTDDIDGMKTSLKLQSRPWIVHDNLQIEAKSDVKQSDMSLPADVCLPMGVIRGCSECSDCQKVTAKWNPEGACTYDLKEAPVFHPSYEELNNTSNYIDSIRQQVEPYGFCRIVPPPSWRFPSFLEEDDIWQNFKFTPKIQRVNELHNHLSPTKEPADDDIREIKRRKLDCESNDVCAENFSSGECYEAESLLLESCPEFTLIAFKRQADYFKKCYFSKLSDVANGQISPLPNAEKEPSEQDVEGEYWRIAEKPTENIDVMYATGSFGSEPSEPNNTELRFESLNRPASGWNLNCISSLPGSLLLLENSDLSGILGPQLHIGMCFSSAPWDVQEHCLYKLHYLHLGAPKIWYGISGADAHEFEAATTKHPLGSLEKHSKLFYNPGSNLSPGTFESKGIPVYRCVQRPGDFMLFLPRAYHSGFDCGFNCSTSTVFAPLAWLPHGLTSTEIYRERKRKTSISYDKLLLRAANEVVKARWDNLVKGEKSDNIMTWRQASGKDGVLTKVLRVRISSEARCREYIASASQSKKMNRSFDADGHKKECSFCCYDLYLSAAICSCNPKKYSCLLHAKDLCSCPWTDKLFLYRYQINELNLLLEAVEGKITPMRHWVREDLSLPLEWDNPKRVENKILEKPSSAFEPSFKKTVYHVETQDFRSSEEDKKSTFEEFLSDDFKSKAMNFLVKNSCDDTSSSSSSDFDIDACIADLESRKTKLESSTSHKGAPSSEKSVSLNHYLSRTS